MTAFARWQETVVDHEGNIQPGAALEVRLETVGAPLATLYLDRDGLIPAGNPVYADADGFVFFHVAGGAYKLTASFDGDTREWRYVGIGTGGETDIAAGTAGFHARYTAANALAASSSLYEDGSGRLIRGHTTAIAVGAAGTNAAAIQGHGTDGLGGATFSTFRWSADTLGVTIGGAKSRGATPGTRGAVQSGDALAFFVGFGDDGVNFLTAGNISFEVDGAVSTGIVPGRAIFRTSNSAGTSSERMRITSAGSVGINTSSPLGIFDVTQSQDAHSRFYHRNVSTGTSAIASVTLSNNVSDTAGSLRLNGGNNSGAVGGTNAVVLMSETNSPVVLATNSLRRVHVTGGGFVGVGTTPAVPFHLVSNNTNGQASFFEAGAVSSAIGAHVFAADIDGLGVSDFNETMVIYNSGADGATMRIGFTDGTAGASCAQIDSHHYASGGGGRMSLRTRVIGDLGMSDRVTIDRNGFVVVGAAQIGPWPNTTTFAMFGTAALDQSAAGNYAMLQSAAGSTIVNAASGQTISLRINNADFAVLAANGTLELALASGTKIKMGASTNRGTTEGTNALSQFNGTAPVGTLTNGITWYPKNGLPYVMDAAGVEQSLHLGGFTPAITHQITASIAFDAANTDTVIPIKLPPGFTRFIVASAYITRANGDLSAGTCGIFTAAAGGGIAVVASGTAIAVTSGTDATNLNTQILSAVNGNTTSYTLATYPNLYFRTQTAAAAGRTGFVALLIRPLP